MHDETDRGNGTRRLWLASITGVVISAIYTATLYLLARFELLPWGFVSFTIILTTPFSIGVLCVAFSLPEQRRRWKYCCFAPWLSIGIVYVGFALIKIETVVCLIMLAPITLGLSTLGGFVAGWVMRRKGWSKGPRNSVVGCFVLLPLLTGNVEIYQPATTQIHTVSNTIIVDASSDQVWRTLINVPDIRDEELSWSLSHTIGLPKPRAALLTGSGDGALRDLYWDGGIHFRERVTDWQPGLHLAYDVDISLAQAALRKLDTHVVIGDRYFGIERGEYRLRAMGPNRTELTLSTTYRIRTHVNGYGNFWAWRTLRDFHGVVLGVLKHRAEGVG